LRQACFVDYRRFPERVKRAGLKLRLVLPSSVKVLNDASSLNLTLQVSSTADMAGVMVFQVGAWSVSLYVCAGNTKGGSITVPLTSCLTGLESAV